MANFTPEPWAYFEDEWANHGDSQGGFHLLMGQEAINSRGSHGIEEHFDYAQGIYPEDGEQYEIAEANIRLMSMAPALLRACKLALSDGNLAISYKSVISHVVDKAEGRA